MLLKMALILGIEIHVNVEFKGLIEPPEDQENESKMALLMFYSKPDGDSTGPL